MADPCDNVSVGVVVADARLQGLSNRISVSARATETTSAIIAQIVSRSVSVGDARTDAFGALVSDSVSVADLTAQGVDAVQMVTSRARARAVVLPFMSNTVSATARATDSMSHRLSTLTVDRAAAGASVSQVQSFTATVADVVIAADVASQFLIELVSKTAGAASVCSGTLRVADLVVKTVQVASALSVAQTIGQSVVDRVTTDAGLSQTLLAVQLVVDDAFADGAALFDSGVAWTAMLETWGMSQWLDLPGDSVGVSGGQFVIGGDGLYVEALPTSSASVDFGVSDFGSPQLKRLSYAYMNGLSADTVLLVGDDDGQDQMWPYDFVLETEGQWGPARARLGRGHRARSFRLSAQMAGSFEIGEIRVIHEPISRKV